MATWPRGPSTSTTNAVSREPGTSMWSVNSLGSLNCQTSGVLHQMRQASVVKFYYKIIKQSSVTKKIHIWV